MKKVAALLFVLIAVVFWTVGIAYYLYRNDFNQAEGYVAALATSINDICNENGTCPDVLDDWQESAGQYSYATNYGISGVPIYFYCTNDKKEFAFLLKHIFRSDVGIQGGVGKEILIARAATGG